MLWPQTEFSPLKATYSPLQAWNVTSQKTPTMRTSENQTNLVVTVGACSIWGRMRLDEKGKLNVCFPPNLTYKYILYNMCYIWLKFDCKGLLGPSLQGCPPKPLQCKDRIKSDQPPRKQPQRLYHSKPNRSRKRWRSATPRYLHFCECSTFCIGCVYLRVGHGIFQKKILWGLVHNFTTKNTY